MVAPRRHGPAWLHRQHAGAGRAHRSRRRVRRHAHRLAGLAPALPRGPGVRVGADAAAGDAGVRDGLCLHRLAGIRGPGPDDAARCIRLVARRLLLPRRALASRRGGDVRADALPLRLSARPHRIPRAAGLAQRGGADDGPDAGAGILAGRPAARAACGRRRHRAGADGNAGRLRHRRVLRRRHVHHRHLPRVVLARRSCRRRATVDAAARRRGRGGDAGTLVAARGAGHRRHPAAQPAAAGAPSPHRRARRRCHGAVRAADRARLPAAGGAAAAAGPDRPGGQLRAALRRTRLEQLPRGRHRRGACRRVRGHRRVRGAARPHRAHPRRRAAADAGLRGAGDRARGRRAGSGRRARRLARRDDAGTPSG